MLGDIGDIQKLRVCAGREDDDNPVWMVEQVSIAICVLVLSWHLARLALLAFDKRGVSIFFC